MSRKNPQSNRILVIMVCLILVLLTVITLALNVSYVHSIRGLVRNTTTDVIGELTVSKAKFLDETISAEHTSLEAVAMELSKAPNIFARSDLLMQHKEFHRVSRVWVFDTAGNGWSTNPDESLIPPDSTEELFAPALRGESGVSDVFIGGLGKRQVMVYVPILRDGQVVGGLYESYPTELLQSTYGDTTYNDAGYSYVLRSDGSVMLTSVTFSYSQVYDNFRDILDAGGNSPEAADEFMQALSSGRTGSATFEINGETQLLYFTPLTEKEGWYFVTVMPLNMVERDGTEIMKLTARMAAVLISAVVLFLLLALATILYRNRRRWEYENYIQKTYQAISQNIDTVIIIVDSRTGRVEHAFENAQDILGIPARKFYKKPDPDAGEFEAEIIGFLRQQRPFEKAMWEISIYNDILGRHMWLEVTALPVILSGVAKYIFAITDDTDDRQIHQDLSAAVAAAEQANSAKSLFLSNMSHDIRTPMNAIVGMTKLAKIYIDDRTRVVDCLDKIELSSRHLLSLINDVLDMSKIESGKMTMAVDPIALPELIEGIYAVTQPQCSAKRQRLIVDTQDIRHEYLLGDVLRLNQVLLNLISNAVKFTPEAGEIKLMIEELPQKHPGYACYRFQVADTGIGIAPESLEKVFKPFERAEGETVRHTEGTGLGLAISKNIVEAMGGQIAVESELGVGTTFTVELELPLQPGEAEEAESARVLIGLRALVVDDTPEDLELMTIYLTELGIKVDAAASGEEALTIAEANAPYDVVLLDWQLPGIDGRETAHQIKAAVGDHPHFVLVTAFDASVLESDSMRHDFDVILQKPIFKSSLCRKLSMLFGVSERDDDDLQDVLRGRRFLLVEDNMLNSEIATELLMLSGAQVECAEDGRIGLETFLAREPGYYDAIFMDIQMPNMNGYEATERIRASEHPQAKDIPIIAMSANVFAEDVQASKRAGMNAHLGKPIVMADVYRTLKELL